MGSFLFALFLSNCCDDPAPCPGFEEEPLLYLRNDSTKFRVIYRNEMGIGDTTLLAFTSKIPMDMNSNSMSYTFLAPENKGTLKLNYSVVMQRYDCSCNEKFVLFLKNVEIDSASTFTNVHEENFRNSKTVRIDSSLNNLENYYNSAYYYYVNF